MIVNDRDLAILAALSKTPLDAQQLVHVSTAFPQPFTHERLVRLEASGLMLRLVDLLFDPEKTARAGAVRAIGAQGHRRN